MSARKTKPLDARTLRAVADDEAASAKMFHRAADLWSEGSAPEASIIDRTRAVVHSKTATRLRRMATRIERARGKP